MEFFLFFLKKKKIIISYSHYDPTISRLSNPLFPLTLSLLDISIPLYIRSFFINPHFVVVQPFIFNNSQLRCLLLDKVLIVWISVVLLVYIHEAFLRF